MRKNFRKIKIGQKFENNFGKVIIIVSQEYFGAVSIDEDGNRYNNSGNCSNKGRSWNLYERLNNV